MRRSWPLVLLASLCSLLGSSNVSASGADATGALVSVGTWNAGFTYRLDSLSACRVGDADLSFANVSSGSVRITGVKLLVPTRVTYRSQITLVATKPGSTTGEVAASFRLSSMDHAPSIGAAVGAVVPPSSINDRWYFLVARITVTSVVSRPWVIRGADVSYVSLGTHHVLHLTQSVVLPAASRC